MAKGFKDDDGKFHPTDRNQSAISSKDIKQGNPDSSGTDSKKASELKEQKQRFKEIKIWKFDDAPKELQEKILEKYRGINVEDSSTLTWGDWLLDSEIFKWNENKIYYDLDREQYIQFHDLEVKDPEKFRKLLGISKPLWTRISFTFTNRRGSNIHGEYNTEIEFTQEDDDGYNRLDEDGKGGTLSEKESEQISNATEKFNDVIHQAWVALRDSYEDMMTDESVRETLVSNEYDFDEDGNIA